MDRTTREKMIAQLDELPGLVETTVSGTKEAVLDAPFRPGGWTARQLVHHLADSHMNAFIRFRLALTEDQPTVKPYNQDAWSALPDSVSLPIDSSLAVLSASMRSSPDLKRALTCDSPSTDAERTTSTPGTRWSGPGPPSARTPAPG